MTTATPTAHTLTRDILVIQIPSGEPVMLSAGTPVTLTQSLGGTYTIQAPTYGGLFRIDRKDADALGLEASPEPAAAPAVSSGPVEEKAVWDQLRTCYDPEIPVNIVDLGLVYDLQITPQPEGGSRVEVKMTLTAPGCGMGTAIAADAREKIARLAGVKEAEVQVVWDPPWSAEMMSEEGKKILGIP
jgi:probable FeS assembly SUF system protein SufT